MQSGIMVGFDPELTEDTKVSEQTLQKATDLYQTPESLTHTWRVASNVMAVPDLFRGSARKTGIACLFSPVC
jgi:hypothetical protein